MQTKVLCSLTLTVCLAIAASTASARPYPGMSGIVASADSAATAGNNPAGMTRFKKRAWDGEVLAFFSDNTWEGDVGNSGRTFKSDDTNTTLVPTSYLIQPINEDFTFGFTILGSGLSEDFGDWPGRYFVESYDLIYVSAFPSLAYRVNDKLSISASLALTYTSYEQERVVLNPLDPGFGEGSMKLEADGTTVGFGLSALYEFTDRTRVGLVYRSELDPELEGDAKFSGLGPNTEMLLSSAGLINADIDLSSRTPQSVLAGIYHEFSNGHAVTFDAVWSDFSRFKLAEKYVNGTSISDNNVEYDDIIAVSASYTWPVNERWMLGVGGLYVDDMIDDDVRTLSLRLDSVWSLGVGVEWQWSENRTLGATVSYLGVGDAPVTSPAVPGLGSVTGEYTSRDIIQLEIGMTWSRKGD
ncbi:MAG: OmpP1/FadL family transporter [Pseudomonadales bacterium]